MYTQRQTDRFRQIAWSSVGRCQAVYHGPSVCVCVCVCVCDRVLCITVQVYDCLCLAVYIYKCAFHWLCVWGNVRVLRFMCSIQTGATHPSLWEQAAGRRRSNKTTRDTQPHSHTHTHTHTHTHSHTLTHSHTHTHTHTHTHIHAHSYIDVTHVQRSESKKSFSWEFIRVRTET